MMTLKEKKKRGKKRAKIRIIKKNKAQKKKNRSND